MAEAGKKLPHKTLKFAEKKAFELLEKKKIYDVIGRINASKLNVRQAPSLNAKVVGILYRGRLVRIINDLGEWYQIKYADTRIAYIYKKYVSIEREEKNGIVTARRLNVRKQPNTESQVLGVLQKGDVVNILKEFDEWLKINYGEREGFIYKTYVDFNDVPLVVDPTQSSTTYFYQRKDLKAVPLEAKKQLSLPSDYNDKIAAKTWNAYGNLVQKISKELRIDIKTALSVLCVESHGHGFADGKLIIRFENHVFDMFWGKNHPKEFWQHFKYDKSSRRNGHYFRENAKGKWEVCHTSQEMEWKVLQFAMKLDQTAALKSISMGAPQVMGFNYKFIGYSSPQEMFEFFKKDIRYHIFALFDFCKYKPERIRYLQKRDFYSFSKEYNGPANPGAYKKRLLKYYYIYRKLL